MRVKQTPFIAMGMLILTSGCGPVTGGKIPTLSASAGRAHVETDGKILLIGSGFPVNQMYFVGVYTTSEAHKVGSLTTDSGGAINNVEIEYPCGSGPNALSAGVYQMDSTNLGRMIASATISGSTCMP